MKKIEEKIRNSWFGDHEAEHIEINDRISVLNWREPGTNIYSVRYVFDRNFLYISGDLGEAVFRLTWNGNPQSFKKVNKYYFHEKLSAYKGPEYNFDSQEAEKNLKEKIDYLTTGFEPGEVADEYFEILEEMKTVAGDCTSLKEWEIKIAFETNLFDRLQEYDSGCWEWVFEIGKVIPLRIKAYLVGLKMAAEQLESDS